MRRGTSKVRIFEEIHVIDEHGVEIGAFTREADPAYYVLINIPEDAQLVNRAIHAPAAQLPRHAGSCSNQNVLNPVGAYVGVEECGCGSSKPST